MNTHVFNMKMVTVIILHGEPLGHEDMRLVVMSK